MKNILQKNILSPKIFLKNILFPKILFKNYFPPKKNIQKTIYLKKISFKNPSAILILNLNFQKKNIVIAMT